jgi:hypothetical protein
VAIYTCGVIEALLPSGWTVWGLLALLGIGSIWIVWSWWLARSAETEGHGFAGFLLLSLLGTPILATVVLDRTTGPLFKRRPPVAYWVYLGAVLLLFLAPFLGGGEMHVHWQINFWISLYVALLLLLGGGSRVAWWLCTLVTVWNLLTLPLIVAVIGPDQRQAALVILVGAVVVAAVALLSPSMRAHRNPRRRDAAPAPA